MLGTRHTHTVNNLVIVFGFAMLLKIASGS